MVSLNVTNRLVTLLTVWTPTTVRVCTVRPYGRTAAYNWDRVHEYNLMSYRAGAAGPAQRRLCSNVL